MKFFLHLIIIIFLTALTQIGGLIYVLSLLLIKKSTNQKRLKRIGVFTLMYLVATFLIVPYLAPVFGREKIKDTEILQAHTFFHKVANRNYVKPEMNKILKNISIQLERQHSGIKLIYLDANFPFFDNFPLLPHLSHNDGKKIDVSFIYKDASGTITNKKPSISGYGVYVVPTAIEYDQSAACKQNGYWQYNFPQYLTFGTLHKDIELSKKGTQHLAKLILSQQNVGKLFIEPHLKSRLNLTNQKVRFHGCQAVRHDDHIHFQLK